MRVLAVVGSFDELAEDDPKLGRKVASRGMVEALLRYSTADELHFFVPFAAALRRFDEVYGPLARGRRVRVMPAMQLPAAVKTTPYWAVHVTEFDRYFTELCHLRNRLASRPFPVTCTPHTISYWSTQLTCLPRVLPGVMGCDAVMCTSRAARESFHQIFAAMAEALKSMGLARAGFRGRLEIVPLGVEAREFGTISRAEARARLGLGEGVWAVCVGRLSASDKFDLMPLLGLVQALEGLGLVLGGAEEGLGRLVLAQASAMGLEGRVRVVAGFPSSLKPAVYAAADMLISPADNLQETFGLNILEAMASRLPVVASDFSGYRDLVVHGRTGLLVPTWWPGEMGLLAEAWTVAGRKAWALNVAQRTAVELGAMEEAVARLVGDEGLRAQMGAAGRRRVEEHYDWAVVVRQMEGLWEELSHQAQRLSPPPAAQVPGPWLVRAFGHFPSGRLDPGVVLAPGPMAAQAAAGRWPPPGYADLRWLEPGWGLKVLEVVRRGGGRVRVGDVLRAVGGQVPGWMVEHAVVYALKYGLVRVVEAGDAQVPAGERAGAD